MKDDNTVTYRTLSAENDSLVEIAVTQSKTPVLPPWDHPFWREDWPRGLGRASHFPLTRDVRLFACFLENLVIQQSGNTLRLEALQSDRIKMSSGSESIVNSSSDENQASDSTSQCKITAIASGFQPYQDEPRAWTVEVGHDAENEIVVTKTEIPICFCLQLSRRDSREEPASKRGLNVHFARIANWKCRCCREVAEAYGNFLQRTGPRLCRSARRL